MKRNTVGDFYKENILLEDELLNSGDPLVIRTPSLAHVDGLSFIVAVANATRSITVVAPDAVIAGSGTWRFGNGNFGPGDVGGTFTVGGASNGGNNGAKVILTVVDATHVTTATTGLVNETFNPAAVTVSLADLAVQATIKIEVSNNFSPPGGTFPTLGQVPNVGKWADITSQFSPSPAAITAAGNQFIQAYPLVAQRARITITPTAGASLISLYYCAKGNS